MLLRKGQKKNNVYGSSRAAASPRKQTEKHFIRVNDMKHLQADLTAFCETTIYSSHALMGSDINYSPSLLAQENPDTAECVAAAYWSQKRGTDRDLPHTHTQTEAPEERD